MSSRCPLDIFGKYAHLRQQLQQVFGLKRMSSLWPVVLLHVAAASPPGGMRNVCAGSFRRRLDGQQPKIPTNSDYPGCVFHRGRSNVASPVRAKNVHRPRFRRDVPAPRSGRLHALLEERQSHIHCLHGKANVRRRNVFCTVRIPAFQVRCVR